MTIRKQHSTLILATVISTMYLVCGSGQTFAGSIVAWGYDYYGQVTNIPPGDDFVAVAGGGYSCLALRSDGSIVAWGENDVAPVGSNFIAVDGSYHFNIALRNDGSITGWGPTNTDDCVAIAGGKFHGLALKSDGSIIGWGAGAPGEWTWPHFGQTIIPPDNDFVAIAAGGWHSLALKSDGSIIGWGAGAPGTGTQFPNLGQATVPAGDDFVAISAGETHSIALKSDGSLVGWGSNEYHQINVPSGNDFVAIASGAYHNLAQRSDGTLVGWGAGSSGSLYDSPHFRQAVPPTGSDFLAFDCGWYHSLAIMSVNSPPVVAITEPSSGALATVGDPVQFAGDIDDPDVGDSHVAVWTMSNEGTAVLYDGTVAGTSVSDWIPFLEAGIYSISLTVTDSVGESDTATTVNGMPAFIVVYDPSAGFVTGGGWIYSPAGSLLDSPAEGRATFGFVAKYKQGATAPQGNTEFIFQAGDFRFKSSSYDWLVVAGSKAMFKGEGDIQGMGGGFKFMLIAVDSTEDKFRIKIWNPLTDDVIYDNKRGEGEEAEPTTIGGGSIVIHKK